MLGSRKKEGLCIKVDKALGQMLEAPIVDDADLSDADESPRSAVQDVQDPSAVAAAKKAARTVITVLMSAYKYPEVFFEPLGAIIPIFFVLFLTLQWS